MAHGAAAGLCLQVGSELDAKARSAILAHVVEYADALTAAFAAVTPPSIRRRPAADRTRAVRQIDVGGTGCVHVMEWAEIMQRYQCRLSTLS